MNCKRLYPLILKKKQSVRVKYIYRNLYLLSIGEIFQGVSISSHLVLFPEGWDSTSPYWIKIGLTFEKHTGLRLGFSEHQRAIVSKINPGKLMKAQKPK